MLVDTDTDFSESEALSSLQTSGAQKQNSKKTAAVSQSEPEDASGNSVFTCNYLEFFSTSHSKLTEHQVMRIETKQAPTHSQPEVVMSDGKFC